MNILTTFLRNILLITVFMFGFSACHGGFGGTHQPSIKAPITAITLHYKRADNNYTGWGLHLWGGAIADSVATQWTSPHAFKGVVKNWSTTVIPIANPDQELSIIVHNGELKSPKANITLIPNKVGRDVWVVEDNITPFFSLKEANVAVENIGKPAKIITVHYKRVAADYSGWGLELWGDAIPSAIATQWTSPRPFEQVSDKWVSTAIPIVNLDADINFVVHKGEFKSPTIKFSFAPNKIANDIWIVQDFDTPFFNADEANLAATQIGSLSSTIDLSTIEPIRKNSSLPNGWNRSANFMQIFVRSYKDSNGDGNGDLQGVISKLDYLQGLGVTGIWLMPIMNSNDDSGYYVIDYRKIEPDYGTMADFEQLIAEAHKRKIGVILDYVMNHSSTANPLFLDAESSVNNSKRDWFVFSQTNHDWKVWGNPTWHPSSSDFYYGVFSAGLPDFNLKNQTVVNYHLNNLRFWLNKGVDGFRFDAAGVLTENGDGEQWDNQPGNHPILKQAQDVIMSYDNRFMICEAPDDSAPYATSNSCIHAFAFLYQGAIKNSATSHALDPALAKLLNSPTKANMPLFLSNHDSFAGDRPINELSGNNLADYKVAAAISLLTSSTPFIYYGEEIGMANSLIPYETDANLRGPMSWTADTKNAGFSTTTPYRSLSTNVATFNVAAQEGVKGSLLEHYKSLYNLRKNYPILGTGNLELKSAAGDKSLIFSRTDGNTEAVVLINLSTSPQNLSVNVGVNNGIFKQQLPASSTTYTSNGTGSITVKNVPAQAAVVLIK